MRFLKTKIRLAQEALQRKLQLEQQKAFIRPIKPSPKEDESQTNFLKERAKGFSVSYSDQSTFTKPTKNIIVNYGKAIFSFAQSRLAKEYIQRHFQKEKIDRVSFNNFVDELRPRLSGYKNFEAVFQEDENDSEKMALYRRVLKMLGVVFMKYFSVNWIIHGKTTHKQVYLQHRFAILRRITKSQDSLF